MISSQISDSIEIVLGAYRSVCTNLAYASVPITTGKRFYDVLDKYHVKSADSLPEDVIYSEIIALNVMDSLEFAESVQKRIESPLVAPSVFEARSQRWSQEAYMKLWKTLISEKVSEVHMIGGWEYSNGCTAEYVHAFMHEIPIYSHMGAPLELNQGVVRMARALDILDKKGYACELLHTNLERLLDI